MVDLRGCIRKIKESACTLLSRAFSAETSSEVASWAFEDWDDALLRLTMVMPRDYYARVLAAMAKATREGLPADTYVMEVATWLTLKAL